MLPMLLFQIKLKDTIRQNGMVHFSIERRGRYYHHFLAYNEIEEETGNPGFAIAEFHENFCGSWYGVARVNLDHYISFDSGNNMQFPFNLSGDKICMIDAIKKEETEKLDKAKSRLLLAVGDTDYDIVENNCEHIANYIMRGTAFSEQAKDERCKAMCYNIPLQSLKSFITILAVCALVVTIGSGTVLRSAHETLLFKFFVNGIGDVQSNSSDCDHNLGKHIIKHTRNMLESYKIETVYSKYQNITMVMDGLIENLRGDELCKYATDIGVEVFWTLSGYFLVTWLFFQSLAFALYIFLKLLPLKKSLERKGQGNRFRKILFSEIMAVYLPIPMCYGVAVIVQFNSTTRAYILFLIIVFSAVISRLLVSSIFNCFTCCKEYITCSRSGTTHQTRLSTEENVV